MSCYSTYHLGAPNQAAHLVGGPVIAWGILRPRLHAGTARRGAAARCSCVRGRMSRVRPAAWSPP